MSDDSIDDHQEIVKFTLDYDAQLNVVNRTVDAFVKRAVIRCMRVLRSTRSCSSREGTC